jgi:hypothetical protein
MQEAGVVQLLHAFFPVPGGSPNLTAQLDSSHGSVALALGTLVFARALTGSLFLCDKP